MVKSMRMGEMERGRVGLIIDNNYGHKGIMFLVGDNDEAHMIGHTDGWSNVSKGKQEVIDITDMIMKGVKDAIK